MNGRRGATATSSFGVGRRESHDASAFYDRFSAPELSDDDELALPTALDEIWVGDARDMDRYGDIADGSVALVVTSPPYFAGKEYEEALGEGHVPASYLDYLSMLRDVFAECVRKLEPGGRLAVNVANLGRKPYRSLSADVITIFEELGLLLRGEIVWIKQRAAGGSCAWGTYQRPGNPVLRDLTERVVVASKGRFDRARSARWRSEHGHPSEGSISMDDFLDATTDIWELPPESATRVGHPAPFPVELPRRLIDLYTYRGDLVLDPFMGSGSAAVAAVRTDRRFVGFDTDPSYVAAARERVAAEQADLAVSPPARVVVPPVRPPAGSTNGATSDPHAHALGSGSKARDVAKGMLEACGFSDLRDDVALKDQGISVELTALDQAGQRWGFELAGAFSSTRPGLRRADTLWKALGRAAVASQELPMVLLSTDAPSPGSPGARALDTAVRNGTVRAVVGLLDDNGADRLAALARGG